MVRVVLPCVLLVILAGCRGSPPRSLAVRAKPGVVTGIATPCDGATTLYAYERIPIEVELRRGTHVVAHRSGHGDLSYRFIEPAGHYTVFIEGAGLRSRPIHVLSATTTRINLFSHCK